MLDDLIQALTDVKSRSQENALDIDEAGVLEEAYVYASGRLHIGLDAWGRGDIEYGMKSFRRAERRLADAIRHARAAA